MKVVFLQKDSFVKISIMQLSALLKKNGHQCDLFIESGEKDFINIAVESCPDLFAFSCTTGEYPWVVQTSKKLKNLCSIPIIAGGPHPTFFPEMLNDPHIDFICRGEGEGAFIDLLEAMESNLDLIKDISNIWSKGPAGEIHRTQLRSFIADLDILPNPDLGVYTKYRYMIPYHLDMFPVMTGRGCPFNCSYCFNKAYKDLYKKKGRYLRKKSPESIIKELEEAKFKYGVQKINFVDDSFLLFPEWVNKIYKPYIKKIGLPFIINVEATHVTRELVAILAKMGCICIRMGVETGNDELRKTVLNKKVSTEQIKKAARIIKTHRIKLSTYNILGLPGETTETALETYQLNREIRTDFSQCSILQPYPGTAIEQYVRERGFLTDINHESSLNESFFVSTKIRLNNEKEILNLQKLMQICIQMRLPIRFILLLLKLPMEPFYHLIFKLSFIYNKIKCQKLKLMPLIRLGMHSLSYMK